LEGMQSRPRKRDFAHLSPSDLPLDPHGRRVGRPTVMPFRRISFDAHVEYSRLLPVESIVRGSPSTALLWFMGHDYSFFLPVFLFQIVNASWFGPFCLLTRVPSSCNIGLSVLPFFTSTHPFRRGRIGRDTTVPPVLVLIDSCLCASIVAPPPDPYRPACIDRTALHVRPPSFVILLRASC